MVDRGCVDAIQYAFLGAAGFVFQACAITSHFNFSTPLNGVLFVIMGAAIVAQTFISIAVAVAFWRQRFEDPAMGWVLRLGMIMLALRLVAFGAFSQIFDLTNGPIVQGWVV